jgi:hypothetical protein
VPNPNPAIIWPSCVATSSAARAQDVLQLAHHDQSQVAGGDATSASRGLVHGGCRAAAGATSFANSAPSPLLKRRLRDCRACCVSWALAGFERVRDSAGTSISPPSALTTPPSHPQRPSSTSHRCSRKRGNADTSCAARQTGTVRAAEHALAAATAAGVATCFMSSYSTRLTRAGAVPLLKAMLAYDASCTATFVSPLPIERGRCCCVSCWCCCWIVLLGQMVKTSCMSGQPAGPGWAGPRCAAHRRSLRARSRRRRRRRARVRAAQARAAVRERALAWRRRPPPRSPCRGS